VLARLLLHSLNSERPESLKAEAVDVIRALEQEDNSAEVVGHPPFRIIRAIADASISGLSVSE
jgi:hypothetical protein